MIIIIVAVWCYSYNRLDSQSWKTPVHYNADTLDGLARAKAFADRDIHLYLIKKVSHLNAPFSANWNDFPTLSEPIYALMGWSSNIFDLMMSANLFVLFAHILAGLSFYYAGNQLKYNKYLVFSLSILFAFPAYIFFRNLVHTTLSYYFIVPLLLFLISQLNKNQILLDKKRWILFLFICFTVGNLNPYYTIIFLQLFIFVLLSHLIKQNWTNAKVVSFFITAMIFGFLLVNADTFIYQIFNGRNPGAVTRNLADIERFGLKFTELFIPKNSRFEWLANWTGSHYFGKPLLIKGETGSPYMGIIGIFGFLWFTCQSVYRFLQGKLNAIPIHFWMASWILFFSVIGGINHIVGTFGLMLLRSTNRYSIVILCISYLFLARQLTRFVPKKFQFIVAFAISAIGIWDQVPPQTSEASIKEIRQQVESDRNFTKKLETILSKNSMIFQLPVKGYPETGHFYRMGDYEHFRPYLFSKHLHFSYGSNKGRPRENWQDEVSKLSPMKIIETLEGYGFSAIHINRKGYKDNANRLIKNFKKTGIPVLAENRSGDMIAFKLSPLNNPVVPDIPPYFRRGWSVDEKTHRWANSQISTIGILNCKDYSEKISITFDLLNTTKPRQVTIYFNSKYIKTVSMIPGKPVKISLTNISLISGENSLKFKTDTPLFQPSKKDKRLLSFLISNLKIHRLN